MVDQIIRPGRFIRHPQGPASKGRASFFALIAAVSTALSLSSAPMARAEDTPQKAQQPANAADSTGTSPTAAPQETVPAPAPITVKKPDGSSLSVILPTDAAPGWSVSFRDAEQKLVKTITGEPAAGLSHTGKPSYLVTTENLITGEKSTAFKQIDPHSYLSDTPATAPLSPKAAPTALAEEAPPPSSDDATKPAIPSDPSDDEDN